MNTGENKTKKNSTDEKTYLEGVATLKDIIAPAGLKIESNYIQLGEKYARTFFIYTYPRYLQTNWFSPVINLDMILDIAMFVHPVETTVILKNLTKTVGRVQSQINLNQEKGLVRDPVLETALKDAEALRDKLQTGTERFFKFGLYLTIYGNDLKDLEKTCSRVESLLESRLIYAKPATFQLDPAFTSTLPLGQDKLMIHSNMNTSPLSTTFPFVSSDLTSNKGILYGINRHNNSLILFDRFSMENGNMVLFAKSGAGKSYAVKLEILRSLMMGTEVIVIDPENEYQYLAEAVGGSFLNISLNSPHNINPFDLPVPQEGENPADILRSNIISLVGLLRIMLGEKTEKGDLRLTPQQDAILDKALTETYALKDITAETDFTNKTPPTMSDLRHVLENMTGGKDLATRLEKYTKGTFAGFANQPTNIDVDKKMVVFSIRDMEDELRPVAMYIILHFIWNLVRSEIKKRILVVDEAWWMMQNDDGGSFLFGIAKRCRKYWLGLTTITQDVTDFLSSKYGKPIVTNSSIQLLMKQSPAAIDFLVKTFHLTDEEKFLLLQSNVGEGIFFAGLKHVAIKVVASYTEDQIITSDPAQLQEIEKAKKELSQQEGKL